MTKATTRWLDQVLATPTVGVLVQPWLGFPGTMWGTLDKLGQAWRQTEGGPINVSARNSINVRMERENGLYLDLSPSNIACGFTYRVSLRDRPGDLPELKLPSRATSYSELRGRVIGTMNQALAVDAASHAATVVRVGHVAECRIDESQAPPGVRAFLEFLGRPWAGRMRAGDVSLLVELAKQGKCRDQCHHGVSLNSIDRPADLTFRLDWQRVWDPPQIMQPSELVAAVTATANAADSYFEQFGAGEWGDEDAIDSGALDK